MNFSTHQQQQQMFNNNNNNLDSDTVSGKSIFVA